MSVWCGDCYRESPTDPFPRLQTVEAEDESEVLLEETDLERHRHGRDGDHLMGVPFECDLCHFRNMNKRDPVWESSKDMATMEVIRRVLLDVFWAREPSTVSGNLSRLRRDYLDVVDQYNIGDSLQPYFPVHEVRDRAGMGAAIAMTSASLREGNYCKNLGFPSTRKSRTWLKHMFNSSSWHQGTPRAKESQGEAKFDSGSPTDQEWFHRFVVGTKKRMGQVLFQNEALTSPQVMGLSAMLDEAWAGSDNEDHKERLEELMTYVLLGFGAGLRGEEVPLMSLKGLCHFWDETRSQADPYLMATLYGKFKGESGYRWHCLPISDQTRSGIPCRRWVGRLMHRRVNLQGRSEGWLLQRSKGRKVRVCDYDSDFLYYMMELHQQRPELFSVGTVMGLYSLRRSMRRGAILETVGRVDNFIVKLMNRWRKKEGARGAEAGLCMRQAYTQMRSMVRQMLLYSKAL